MSHTAGPWHVAPGDSRRVVLPGLAKTIDAGNNGNAALIAKAPIAPKLVEALRAVVGHGYCPGSLASAQDFVSKDAIALVRKALAEWDAQ